jgi:hypothetical protein
LEADLERSAADARFSLIQSGFSDSKIAKRASFSWLRVARIDPMRQERFSS